MTLHETRPARTAPGASPAPAEPGSTPARSDSEPPEPRSAPTGPGDPAAGPGGPGVPGGGPGPVRRVARVLRLWYGRLLCALAVLWLLYAVVRWQVSGRWHWAILLDAAPPLLLLAVPALLLAASAAACGRRRPWAAGISATALVLALLTGSGINWPALWRDEPTVPPGALRIVSLNTQYWAADTGVDRLYELLHRQEADVYLLQEHVLWQPGLGEEGYRRIDDDARLREEFPGYHIARRGELLTISRFPVVAKPLVGPGKELDRETSPAFKRIFERDKVMRTDLQVGDRVLSVYNVHVTVQLAPDNLNPFADFDFDAYFQRKFDWRREEVAGLERDLRDNPHPVVIAGDFNSTAAMRDLDGVRSLARDALEANTDLLPLSWKFPAPVGFDWDSVFNRPLPFWRVDWAFTAGDVRAHRYELRPTDGISEHRLQDLWITL
ncbi:endonuclease/exonuclease/phosphatase family protein [Streptomyces sp. NPDC005805]|uniref:endonuclease/exonuclease/phosphatase family protein n=1 Tax=Streptomyces sp. NPDC005805 TaxID=3157068 RepID=UPI003405692E